MNDNDLIAGTVMVEHHGQTLDRGQELALEEALDKILIEISRQDCIEDADVYLDRLGYFQTELARACFKWGMQLPDKLRRLVHEFDQSEDSDLRLVVFKKIREGNFLKFPS